jgi:hypothetical protein
MGSSLTRTWPQSERPKYSGGWNRTPARDRAACLPVPGVKGGTHDRHFRVTSARLLHNGLDSANLREAQFLAETARGDGHESSGPRGVSPWRPCVCVPRPLPLGLESGRLCLMASPGPEAARRLGGRDSRSTTALACYPRLRIGPSHASRTMRVTGLMRQRRCRWTGRVGDHRRCLHRIRWRLPSRCLFVSLAVPDAQEPFGPASPPTRLARTHWWRSPP